MEKVIITKVFRTDTDKAGAKLINKNGKEYTKCNIQTKQHGEKYLSGFGNKTNENWKIGDEVEIIVKTVVSNGTEYLNYETPKAEDLQKNEIEVLKTKLWALTHRVDEMAEYLKVKFGKADAPKVEKTSDGIDYPDEQPSDSIPF